MKRANIAPDRTRTTRPVHTGDTVMVASQETQDVVADHVVLVGRDIVDAANVQAHTSEQGLPSGDRVRSNYGMGRRKLVVYVLRRAAWRHDIVTTSLAGRLEHGLRAGCSQCLEEFLELRGQAIV